VSHYKVYCGQVTSHVTQSFKGSTGAVGLQPNRKTVSVPEIDCKKRDKPINFIVRVIASAVIKNNNKLNII
jgi:hypothetical protein